MLGACLRWNFSLAPFIFPLAPSFVPQVEQFLSARVSSYHRVKAVEPSDCELIPQKPGGEEVSQNKLLLL